VSSFPAAATLVINGSSFPNAGSFQLAITGASGAVTHTLQVLFSVGDYSISGSSALSSSPGSQVTANLNFNPTNGYGGEVSATCDASSLSGTQCTISPQAPIAVAGPNPVPFVAIINLPTNATPGLYHININSQDVTGTPSSSFQIALTIANDFAMGTLTPKTQSIKAGGSASYNFMVIPIGASFTNAVSFSCTGQPALSLCSFSPTTVTPGANTAAAVLTIGTTASSASVSRPPVSVFFALWLSLPGLALLRKRARLKGPAFLLGLVLLAFLLPSCGGGGSNGGGGGGGGGQQQGTQPGTYTITVTGTSGTLSHQATPVTLVVTQ